MVFIIRRDLCNSVSESNISEFSCSFRRHRSTVLWILPHVNHDEAERVWRSPIFLALWECCSHECPRQGWYLSFPGGKNTFSLYFSHQVRGTVTLAEILQTLAHLTQNRSHLLLHIMLNLMQTLHGKIFCPHKIFPIAWIPVKMAGFRLPKMAKQC